MIAERPAAGSTEYAASIEQIRRRTKKLFTAFAAAALCMALLWFSLGAADYVRVMNLHTRPPLSMTKAARILGEWAILSERKTPLVAK